MGLYGGRLCAALLTVACIQGVGTTSTPAQVQSSIVPRGTVLVLVPVQPGRPIFDLFARLHKSTEYAGTGVGLALVKKAMERMMGKVGIESVPGDGSCFWLEFRAPR